MSCFTKILFISIFTRKDFYQTPYTNLILFNTSLYYPKTKTQTSTFGTSYDHLVDSSFLYTYPRVHVL